VGGALALVTAGCTPDDEVTDGPVDSTDETPPGVGFPGMDGRVAALAVYGDRLIAGGDFITAGGDTVNHVAAWNGSDWDSLGGGITARETDRGTEGAVSALAVYDGSLVVGGDFGTAGGVPSDFLALWDGTAWSTLEQGTPNGPVTTLLVDGTDLYVGGEFAAAGGAASRNIARYNGTTWVTVGGGVGAPNTDDVVNTLATYNDQLIAGGSFGAAGDTVANNIARWTGTRWAPLGDGFDGTVLALTSYEDRLYAAGLFDEANGTWQTQVAVDEGFDAGSYVDLEIDREGNSHVIYYDATNGDARYAFYDGDTWTDELIDAAGDVGQYGSIEVLDDGTPYVSYYDASGRDIKFAFRPGDTWLVETVRMNGDVGTWSSLALDAMGRAHIAYYHADSSRVLEMASQSGSGWTFQVVDNGIDLDTPQLGGFDVGRASRLVIDDGGRFHVAYYDATSRGTRYALRSGAGWNREYMDRPPQGGTADTTQTRGLYLALTVDAAGQPHAAVHEFRGVSNGGERLRYLRKQGENWTPEIVESPTTVGTKVGRYPSIAIDRDGIPQLAYADVTRGKLRQAFRAGLAQWRRLSLDENDVGQFTAMALVNDRFGRIAYYDQGQGRLKFAERGQPTAIRRIACWDGSGWSELGEGLDWWARTLFVRGAELLVGGAFTEAGGMSVERLASWDGSSWAPVTSGLDGNVWALELWQGSLYAGGEFTRRGSFSANYVVKLD
jgi:hypothetical protein